MHDPIQDGAVTLPLRGVPEHAAPQGGPVQHPAVAVGVLVREQEVGRRGEEVREDREVACGAGFDDAPGEEVGVDDGEGVGRGGEDGGDG